VSHAHFARSQKMTIVMGILALIGVIVILQLWLFTATMEAFLGGDDEIVAPAGLASLVCLGLGLGLRRYLKRLDR
jgi:uncharacterized membrane-anchored protein